MVTNTIITNTMAVSPTMFGSVAVKMALPAESVPVCTGLAKPFMALKIGK